MRLAPALTAALAPALLGGGAVAFGACGGTEFIAGADDAGPSTDAPVVTGPKQSFCEIEAGTHTFCDDFDDEYDGSTLTSLWPDYDRTTGGTAQDDPTIFVSPPSSFEAACEGSVGTIVRGRVGKTFAPASRVVIAFDLHLDAVGAKPNVAGGTTFVLLTLGPNYSLGLTANSTAVNGYEDITAADGGVTDNDEMVTATPAILGSWVHVSVDANLAERQLSANVNGTAFGPIALTPPTQTASTTAPAVFIGLSSREVVAPVEAHYDNVTIDVTPQ
jgi:hypothetical protein